MVHRGFSSVVVASAFCGLFAATGRCGCRPRSTAPAANRTRAANVPVAVQLHALRVDDKRRRERHCP